MPVNPLEAYQSIEKNTLSGRHLEASVLIRAAQRLVEAQRQWHTAQQDTLLQEALHYNQRIWTLFQTELTTADNPMPAALRENLLSLSAFIDKRTFEVMSYPEPAKLDILISINKNIAAGLRGEIDT